MRRPDGSTLFLGAAIIGSLALVMYVVFLNSDGQAQSTKRGEPTLATIPFDGQRSYEFLKQICELGPRISGTPAMTKQQELLTAHFEKLGGRVSRQEFKARHPLDGSAVTMTNLIVEWHPEAKERILLCAHYDTRPLPDQDPDFRLRKSGVFLGANDGASGAALLAEMAQHMAGLKSNYGVDFVLFDGEELVYEAARDPYFLGSEHFAREYKSNPPAHRYRWGVLVDMIGDASLELFQEKHSMTWRDTRPLTTEIWKTARDLGVKEFYARLGHEVRDDHLALHDIAGIPTCDIIDFDYPKPGTRTPYWHTTHDTPDKCSALSLAKVGWVLLEWLKRTK
ncbi:MAG TPA: M28 family peptidase [Pirellulaceae bacterium]|nr:M28 family peptidase [Pirellulaceae bacterium]